MFRQWRLICVSMTLMMSAMASSLTMAESLSQMTLKNGKSRFVKNPDYFFKLYEQIRLNSGYEKALEAIKDHIFSKGILSLSSDQLYELDAETRKIIDPILQKYFPGKLQQYNLVFLDSEDTFGEVISEPGKIPTIFIGLGLLQLLDSEETLLAVVLHEMGHVLRANFSKDDWYDRLLKNMTEESRVDGMAARILLEEGRNPLGLSTFFEKILSLKIDTPSNYGDNKPKVRSGFSSHPPSELRITKLNAMIEKAAERKTLTAPKPLPAIFAEAAQTKLTNRHRGTMSVVWNEDLKSAIIALNRTLYPPHLRGEAPKLGTKSNQEEPEVLISSISQAAATLRSRINKQNLPLWQISNDWQDIAVAFEKLWENIPNSLKSSKLFRDFYFEEEKRWTELAASYGATFIPNDRNVVNRFTSILAIHDPASLIQWRQQHAQLSSNLVVRYKYLAELGAELTYSIFEDPQIYRRAFEKYIDLIPTLYAWTNEAVTNKDHTLLEAVRSIRDVMTCYLQGWMVLELHNPTQQVLKSVWNAKSLSLSIPDYAKLAFLPSLKISGNSWSWENEKVSGRPLFGHAVDFILNPDREDKRYSNFHKGLEFILALQVEKQAITFQYTEESEYHSPRWADFLGIDQSQLDDWYFFALSRLRFDADEANQVLQNDRYWKELSATDKDKIKRTMRTYINTGVDVVNFFGAQIAYKKRNRLNNDSDKEVESLFSKATFYTRPEYQVETKYNESMQAMLYKSLKDNHVLPEKLSEEYQLWLKFAHRGVTSFTDEWADSFISRIEKTKLTAENLSLVREMYFSNLVWDLQIRQRMAKIVLHPQNSTEVLALQQSRFRAKLFRRSAISRILSQIKNEFPESSQERIYLVDQVAAWIRSDPEETYWMMKQVEFEQGSLTNLSITRKEAFGERFYSQLFSELSSTPLQSRIELLNFLLGRSDYIPELLKYQYNIDRDEKKQRPLLTAIRESNVNPLRLRRAFQTLSVEVRTVLIDPMFIGENGILLDRDGRNWIIDALVPHDATWRQMAVDLADGYREALQKFGQGHLKTMFVSYLIASSIRTSRGVHTELFPQADATKGHDTVEGRVLHALFSANAALTKIGQRVHSSNVLNADINSSLVGLKDGASKVLREDQFAWIDNAGVCDHVCKQIQLREELGNASVKIVAEAKIAGQETVLYMIKPNAFHRGDTFFQMLIYAVNYAINKGHDQLKLVLPMVARSQTTFKNETDLEHERAAAEKLASVYKPDQAYGQNFYFITPEFIETSHLLKPGLAAAVKKIKARRFSELDTNTQKEMAAAITEKEAQVHRLGSSHPTSDETLIFEKDRHEGNYLYVTDEQLLAEMQLPPGSRVILVIDFGQVAEIDQATQSATLNSLAVIVSLQTNMIPMEKAVSLLKEHLNSSLLKSSSPLIKTKVLQKLIEDHIVGGDPTKVGETLSRLFSYLEAEHVQIKDEVWDYLTAASTMQTWEQYGASAFKTQMAQSVGVKCMELLLPPGK